jgi:3-oxoacyl-[acyl-carrier protein] reductase
VNARFSGSRVLVLGGTCEIAITLAGLMAGNSLFPILTYRDERGRRALSESLQALEGRYAACFLNLGDRDSLDSLFRCIGDDLDYLVDFAQGDLEGYIASADEDLVCRYFMENVAFRAEVLKRAGRTMLRNKRGRLVFVSSAAAQRANPGQGFYAAAKVASEALYRNMGLELGARGVTAVTLRLGYVDAGRGRVYLQGRGSQSIEKVPIRRVLTCEEVAETILFLLSDGASGINATEVTMDGGLTSGK